MDFIRRKRGRPNKILRGASRSNTPSQVHSPSTSASHQSTSAGSVPGTYPPYTGVTPPDPSIGGDPHSPAAMSQIDPDAPVHPPEMFDDDVTLPVPPPTMANRLFLTPLENNEYEAFIN